MSSVPARGCHMKFRVAFLLILSFVFLFFLVGAPPASADSSHVRVIRLSLVQGDVRFTRDSHGDPLADSKAVWETAQPNLPIRHGYVLATDNGRAEVEFENGALAFLDDNTVLDFYDLSLDDGARTTRLILRQGSASFYVNPASGDYFSVTGGDFTAEVNGKGSFRMNNFDDGSNISVLSGHVTVVHGKEDTLVSKNQLLSMKAGEPSVSLAHPAEEDDFDHWVSGRSDTVSSATTASSQYTTAGGYAPGFADLYTYGSWSDCGGYGFGWRPFGAGFGWSPFSAGQWLWDPTLGWTFASSQPWGWAPYHYGGWLFDASCGGWFYSPPFYYGAGFGAYVPGTGRKPTPPTVHPPHPLLYRASTAVFVRQNGQLGIVPMNPSDKEGKTPLNLAHGVFSPAGGALLNGATLSASGGASKWETLKSPPHDAMNTGLVATSAPERVSRTLIEGSAGTRVISLGHDSSIVYDPREHRFVNTNSAAPQMARNSEDASAPNASETAAKDPAKAGKNKPAGNAAVPGVTRAAAPPRAIPNPPAARSSESDSRGAESFGSSHGSSAASVAPPHASAPASSGGGGGRPH
jgi:FecR protein